MTAKAHIRFDRVGKAYGSLKVVDDLSLDIAQGEFISLLGPSGSGKTTLLMVLAGFETLTEGEVWLNDKPIAGVPPYRRDMGVVFQNYALFPHMTVAQNIAFPLLMRKVPKAEIAERVKKALDMVQLPALKDRKTAQMSGGQQQRIALARALVFEPTVVLMDEPLGALDKQLREQMQLDIRELHRRLGLTIVFVTHDQSEALTMSDRIAVFNRGKIEQVGTPRDIYDRPASRFVAQFIGETNTFEGTVDQIDGGHARIRLNGGGGFTVSASSQTVPGRPVTLSVRPERIVLERTATGPNSIPAVTRDSVYQGDHLRVMVDSDIAQLIVRTDRRAPEWPSAQSIFVNVDPSDCWVIPS